MYGFKESFYLDGVEIISIDRIIVNFGIIELNFNLSFIWLYYKILISIIRL